MNDRQIERRRPAAGLEVLPEVNPSVSLTKAKKLNEGFLRLSNMAADDIPLELDRLEAEGLITPALSNVIFRVCDSIELARMTLKGDDLKSQIRKQIFNGGHVPDRITVSSYPLALEIVLDEKSLGILYDNKSYDDGDICPIPAGFAQANFVVSTSAGCVGIPIIAIQERYEKGSVVVHERTHNEHALMTEAKITPQQPNTVKAKNAARRFLEIAKSGNDVAVFSCEEWDVLQQYADRCIANEILAQWMAVEDHKDMEWFLDKHLLEVDSPFYNYFMHWLGIPKDLEYFRFIWNTYEPRVRHNIKEAFELHKQYLSNTRFEARREALGRALMLVPLEEWDDYIKSERLTEEWRALEELDEVIRGINMPEEFPEVYVTSHGVTYDLGKEHNRLSREANEKAAWGKRVMKTAYQMINDNPEMVITDYVRAAIGVLTL